MANKRLLAVFSVLLVWCDAEAHEVCVCPHDLCLLDKNNCLPFQILIQEGEFSPDTDVKFSNGTYAVSGNDSVNYNMVVRDTRNIRLLGDPSGDTIIECNGWLKFSFINITNLTISDIQFVSCGAPWRSISREAFQARIPENNPAAHLLVNILGLLMFNVVVTHSQGYGMLFVNLLGESYIMNTNFTLNNKFYKDGVGGSVLLVFRDSSVYPTAESARILINNCNFFYCHLAYERSLACPKIPSVSGLGTVIKQSEYPIHVVVNHTNFTDNDAPAVAVYNHNTPASYNILVQHSYFRNVFWGDVNDILRKTATIMFSSLINKPPSVYNIPNTTITVARTINMQNNVFTGPVDGRYDIHFIGYIDVTLFLNTTVVIKNCVFLASITTAAIHIRSMLQDAGLYPDHDKLVKIVECNFTGLQEGAIIVFTTTVADLGMHCYRHIFYSLIHTLTLMISYHCRLKILLSPTIVIQH